MLKNVLILGWGEEEKNEQNKTNRTKQIKQNKWNKVETMLKNDLSLPQVNTNRTLKHHQPIFINKEKLFGFDAYVNMEKTQII